MMYRSLSRRRFMQWAGLGTASLTLAACAVPPAAEGASGEAMAEPVPLRIAHWWGEAFDDPIEAFAE